MQSWAQQISLWLKDKPVLVKCLVEAHSAYPPLCLCINTSLRDGLIGRFPAPSGQRWSLDSALGKEEQFLRPPRRDSSRKGRISAYSPSLPQPLPPIHHPRHLPPTLPPQLAKAPGRAGNMQSRRSCTRAQERSLKVEPPRPQTLYNLGSNMACGINLGNGTKMDKICTQDESLVRQNAVSLVTGSHVHKVNVLSNRKTR